jgi:hypothetical protein
MEQLSSRNRARTDHLFNRFSGKEVMLRGMNRQEERNNQRRTETLVQRRNAKIERDLLEQRQEEGYLKKQAALERDEALQKRELVLERGPLEKGGRGRLNVGRH